MVIGNCELGLGNGLVISILYPILLFYPYYMLRPVPERTITTATGARTVATAFQEIAISDV
jgi:hypothetical protein